jgi:hypothetical protein
MRLKALQLFAGILPLWTSASGADEAVILKEDQEITFNYGVMLEVLPPCAIGSSGSKLVVTPQEVSFAGFMESVSWSLGVPGYLKSTPPDSKAFDFDLIQTVTFSKRVILKIERVTTGVTTEGIVVIKAGSRLPTVLKKGVRKSG